MKTPIHTFLSNYAGSGTIRCHMPGGKGKINPLDITEIDGADNLYEADGIIRESEELAASLFGAGATLYSCGGSTLVIQGMLALLRELTPKRTIVAGRYSHKSLINACILLGFDIKWAYPAEFLSGAITSLEIEKLIDSDTAGVFVTSIDYYGGDCDIAAISAVCAENNVPLLVDNAHGAYRVFTKNHPMALGADMCADSAHKTLPALTGAAYLHLKDGSLRDEAKRAMALFGSSSPSYPIMDSLDLCNPFIDGRLAAAVGAVHNIAVLKGWL
ncbi:MAG: aminotransferase class V-fold PLP-dependent enzyme, partial [Ruminiclostridium sp.]|nr:aminotransferase class V-fold PLP-dependent enzyme [Ruminiclostridium sp.]